MPAHVAMTSTIVLEHLFLISLLDTQIDIT
jgi:hypothetical protein